MIRRSRATKEQEDGHSLVAQLNRLHDYCERKNLDIIQEFSIVESSTRGERPEFQKLISFIKKQPNKIALVCDKVDRLQRSFREVPILEKLRKSGKLVLHFISDNQVLDANANNSQLMAYHIFVMLAENYTNCISNNVKRSFEKKLKEGTILAAAPVGYIKKKKNEKYKCQAYSTDHVKNCGIDSLGVFSFFICEAEECGLHSECENRKHQGHVGINVGLDSIVAA